MLLSKFLFKVICSISLFLSISPVLIALCRFVAFTDSCKDVFSFCFQSLKQSLMLSGARKSREICMVLLLKVFYFSAGGLVVFGNNVHGNSPDLVRMLFLLIQMISILLFQIMRRLFDAITPIKREEKWLNLQPVLKEVAQ